MRWLILLLLLLPATAAAHPLAPVALSVEEDGANVVAQLKRSRVQPRGATFAPRFPASCEPIAPVETEEETGYVIERHRLRCGALVGAAFGVDGLTEADLDAVVQVRLADGRVVDGLLDHSGDELVVPRRTSSAAAAMAFVRSGFGHLIGGWDHLLFVLGLALLLRRPRRVLIALTAFTAGHALSMCATVLGWISLPARIAELAIAATLVWLARELLVRAPDDRTLRRPYLAALGIGLVHGLGFASAFAEAGLDGAGLPLRLGAFHIGIELGQLAVVALALLLIRSLGERPKLALVSAYAIGGVACMWLIERTLLLIA